MVPRRSCCSLPVLNEDSDHMLAELRGEDEESRYLKRYEPHKQTWKLFLGQAVHLLFTFILLAIFIAALKIYEHKHNVGSDSRVAFNTIMTVLSLALGINFLEAFKNMAKVLRWRVLANRHFTVREADLILGGESLMKLMTLMWESRRKLLTVLVCAFWIALNLLAQATVAMISLNYSMDSGTNSSDIITSPGWVHAPKLDCYYNGETCSNHPPAAPETPQTIAHAYGESTRGQKRCPYSTVEDILAADQTCSYFNRTDGQEFALRYREYNLDDSAGSYPFLTDRIVKASPGNCLRYKVNRTASIYRASTDGPAAEMVLTIYNDTYKGTMPIPRTSAALDATTYIWNGTNTPQNATVQACGPRCLWVYAYQSDGGVIPRPPLVFRCPITISEVSGVTNQRTQNLPDENARLAAASIALSGRYTNPKGTHGKVWSQYRLYPFGSYWEINNTLTPQEIGSRISEFAIGSLSSMAALNPLTEISGTVPSLGYHLNVTWKYVIALMACISGVHITLVGLTLWISRPIVVAGDSNLVVARLLEGLVRRLEGRGTLLDGREIAKVIQKHGSGGGDRVVYGVKQEDGKGRVLELSEEVQIRRKLVGGKFPRG